jgi:site-specific recombinase XerD
MTLTDFGQRLSAFLSDYLPAQRDLSPNTIRSYRDTFVLLLRYCRDVRGMNVEGLTLPMINAALITDFLNYLEQERHCRTATRNQRLAAIHAFFRYAQAEAPEALLECQRILLLPMKRHPRTEIAYLSVEEITAVLRQPGRDTPQGRRDAVLLSLLYDTGARVQELVDLTVGDLRLETPAQVRLTGKGRRVRVVPLLPQMTKLLQSYLEEHHLLQAGRMDRPLFQNRYGQGLTRSGVRYLVQKYIAQARSIQPSLGVHVTPHVFRHTKAMHLLQAGNALVVIRNLLGHADVRTTEVYAKADMRMKRQALEKAAYLPPAAPEGRDPSWLRDHSLLDWLTKL